MGATIITSTLTEQTYTELKHLQDYGSIEGIFVVRECADRNSAEITSKAVHKLDSISRQLSTHLKYFAIISISDGSEGSDHIKESEFDNIFDDRNKRGLPAVHLRYDWSKFDRTNGHFTKTTRRQVLINLLDSIESSLRLDLKNVRILNTEKQKCCEDAFSKILKIIGLQNQDEINETTSLGDLNLSDIQIEEINKIISNVNSYNHDSQYVRDMSIVSLKHLSTSTEHKETSVDCGIEALYKDVDTDEVAADELVRIINNNRLTYINELKEFLDPDETYLITVPGFDENTEVFRILAERLKIPAISVQLGPIEENESIISMAEKVLKNVKRRVNLKSKFYILGYSFGVLLTLELARLLEKEGRKGIVYCLDGSPEALRVQLDVYLGQISDAHLQTKIINHIFKLITKREDDKLKQELDSCISWSDKKETFIKKLKSISTCSHQYAKALVDTFYNKIRLAKSYEPDFKLESEIILMKAVSQQNIVLTEDYNLSKYARHPVTVCHLQTDTTIAPHNNEAPNIVNKMLDAEYLKLYEKKNLCDVDITIDIDVR